MISLGCIIDTGRGRGERLAIGPSTERALAALLKVPRVQKFDPWGVMSWVDAAWVLEGASRLLGEYGGGGTVIGSAFATLSSLSHIFDEMIIIWRQVEIFGKGENKSANSLHSDYHFLPTLCLE